MFTDIGDINFNERQMQKGINDIDDNIYYEKIKKPLYDVCLMLLKDGFTIESIYLYLHRTCGDAIYDAELDLHLL